MNAGEEEDWVKGRIEAEDRSFYAKRQAASLAHAMTWEEEKRALQVEEFSSKAVAVGMPIEEQATLTEYEARMSELTRARPKTRT